MLNVTMAGSDTAGGGSCGLVLKSVGTLMLCVEIAYSASDGRNCPASSVDDGAIVRLAAPSTDTNSYTAPPFTTSPSTSKKVVCIEPNAGIVVDVPDCTNWNRSSVVRMISAVPSRHVAVARSTAAVDAHSDGRMPKPMHAKPAAVNVACVVKVDCGFQYSTATLSE